jgi:hypothetical protein
LYFALQIVYCRFKKPLQDARTYHEPGLHRRLVPYSTMVRFTEGLYAMRANEEFAASHVSLSHTDLIHFQKDQTTQHGNTSFFSASQPTSFHLTLASFGYLSFGTFGTFGDL